MRVPRLRLPRRVPWFAVLAILGILGGIGFVLMGSKPPPIAAPASAPTVPPYENAIAGTGMVEAGTRNIAISTPVGGAVSEVFVKVGDRVRAGDALFRLDSRDLEAQLAVRAALAAAAHAQVDEAQAALDQARDPLKRAQALPAGNAISLQDLASRRLTVDLDTAKLATARANAHTADAEVAETRIDLDRLTVRAPLAGDVLQLNVKAGEYAQTGALATPLLLLGDDENLHLRVDIDENDAWRLKAGTPAKAFLRGNSAIAFDVTFAYVEPYVLPKEELSGNSAERVDTRVLQAVYAFRKGDLPIYVGQQVDVYIETPVPTGNPAIPLRTSARDR
jgi:RND family efflux transporter MFP subunit